MDLNTTLPGYLAQRAHWTDQTVSRDIQVGAQLAQQSAQERRMNRALQMQEEVRRYALEEKEMAAEGTVAVMRVLSEMGKTGGYTDPALQAQFSDAVMKHPKFAGTKAFSDIMDTFQYAEREKARKELLSQTYVLRGDATEQRHLFRLDEIDAQLEKALATENLSQEGRLNLESMRHNNRQEIIRLRPSGTRPAQLDLDKSDQMLMDAELDNLKEWRSIHPGTKHDVEYQQRLNGIEQKFAARRKSSAQPAASPAAPAPTSTAPAVATVPPPAERKAGTIYQTPKGPFRWNGTGWEAP